MDISGGSPFRIEVSRHPLLEHDGVKSVWHTNLEPAQVAAIKDVAEKNGATVQVFSGDDDGSKAESIKQSQELQMTGWKTHQCPMCYFCDLTIPSKCGKMSWGSRVLATAMKHPKAGEAAAKCPLNKMPLSG